jgi:hypothetical protein
MEECIKKCTLNGGMFCKRTLMEECIVNVI